MWQREIVPLSFLGTEPSCLLRCQNIFCTIEATNCRQTKGFTFPLPAIWRFNLISSHLRLALASVLFPWGIMTKVLYKFPLSYYLFPSFHPPWFEHLNIIRQRGPIVAIASLNNPGVRPMSGCFTPYSVNTFLACFQKMKVRLSYHQSVCLSVCLCIPH
jgi:hypothetical protein